MCTLLCLEPYGSAWFLASDRPSTGLEELLHPHEV